MDNHIKNLQSILDGKTPYPKDPNTGKPETQSQIQAQLKSVNNYKTNIADAQRDGRGVVAYTNSKGTKSIALQLTKNQLANAIKAYQVNPSYGRR